MCWVSRKFTWQLEMHMKVALLLQYIWFNATPRSIIDLSICSNFIILVRQSEGPKRPESVQFAALMVHGRLSGADEARCELSGA